VLGKSTLKKPQSAQKGKGPAELLTKALGDSFMISADDKGNIILSPNNSTI